MLKKGEKYAVRIDRFDLRNVVLEGEYLGMDIGLHDTRPWFKFKGTKNADFLTWYALNYESWSRVPGATAKAYKDAYKNVTMNVEGTGFFIDIPDREVFY